MLCKGMIGAKSDVNSHANNGIVNNSVRLEMSCDGGHLCTLTTKVKEKNAVLTANATTKRLDLFWVVGEFGEIVAEVVQENALGSSAI